MSKIVISGYYGFANAGDEAMLTAIIKSLRSLEPEVEIKVISGNPELTAKTHQVKSLHRFNLFELLPALAGCDLLVSGGGSLLQDVTSKRSLMYYLSIVALAKLFSKKVMLFAQGIGPIRSSFMRKLTKQVASKADLITVRDKDSLYEMRRIGVPENKVEKTADAVFTLPQVDIEAGKEQLLKFNVPQDKMLIAISVRSWQEDDSYLLELAKAADGLAMKRKAHIVLLPLQYPADVEVCRRVQQFMDHKEDSTVLEIDTDTEGFLSIIGNFDLLVGMRLHALIFAAVMKVPFVAVSYDPKVDGFIKDVSGVCAGSVGNLQAQKVIAAAGQALLFREDTQDVLQKLREVSELNAQKAMELIKK